MRNFLVVAALLAAALAGCLAGGAPDLQAVSSSLIDDAREKLGEDAVLYSIAGMEPNEALTDEDTDGCGAFPQDSKPGDGKAPAWFYFYGSPSTREALVIVTDEKSRVRCDMDASLTELGGNPSPLGSWNVTSVQAAQTLAEEADDYNSVVDGAMVMMTLAQTPTGPVWSFVAINFETGDFASWGVDATTREYLGDLGFGIDVEIPAFLLPEGGTATGSGTGAFAVVLPDPAAFSIQAGGHKQLAMVIESTDPLAGLGLSYEVQVQGPGELMQAYTPVNGESIVLAAPPSGAYEVIVFPVLVGVAFDFTVTYCAYTDVDCGAQDSGTDGFAASWLPGWVR